MTLLEKISQVIAMILVLLTSEPDTGRMVIGE